MFSRGGDAAGRHSCRPHRRADDHGRGGAARAEGRRRPRVGEARRRGRGVFYRRRHGCLENGPGSQATRGYTSGRRGCGGAMYGWTFSSEAGSTPARVTTRRSYDLRHVLSSPRRAQRVGLLACSVKHPARFRPLPSKGRSSIVTGRRHLRRRIDLCAGGRARGRESDSVRGALRSRRARRQGAAWRSASSVGISTAVADPGPGRCG